VQLGLAHNPLHAQHQAVIEQSRVIHPIGVGDQRVARASQIQQPVPRAVIAGQPGDLQRDNDPDLAQRHLGHQRLKPRPLPQRRARHTKIGVDDPDLATGPAQHYGPFHQVILSGGGLGVALELGEGGLADIDHGRP
jgi:hypothetical protein